MRLMTRTVPLALALATVSCGTTEEDIKADPEPTAPATAEPVAAPAEKENVIVYPDTKEVAQEDDYHGTVVKDPYRWLEDPDAEDTKAWVTAENKVTFGYLEQIKAREEIKTRLTELWNYARYSSTFKEGGRYFFYKNDGLQNQSVLYTQKALDQEPEVLLDPNTLSKDGTIALSEIAISDDGKRLAYSLSDGGSDWKTWKVRDIETKKDLPDEIKWSKFSDASWAKDGSGFYYSRYPAPKEGDDLEEANYFHKVYFHKLGTPQEKDQLVFEEPEHKERGFDARVTEDGKFLVIHVWKGTDRRNRLYYKALSGRDKKVKRILDDFDAAYEFVGNKGNTFYIRTDLAAPKGRLVAIDIRKPQKKFWKEIVSEGEDKIESVKMIGGGFLVGKLHNAYDKLTFHDYAGKALREIELPAIGSVGGFSGKSQDKETWYTFTSFTYPNTVFHLDLTTGKSTLFRKPEVKFNPDDYETQQVWYASKDGTKIPMFVVHKKGLEMNGENPTYLYGYGGFNISLTPSFSVGLLGWLERGGVFALPNLRGGGEFGEAWHEAGMLEKKQNVFDDFAWAAKHLFAMGVTKSDKLAIGGGSNGGLLVGATITQNPDLVGAAIAQVGVLDMLRYHRFTIGHAWVSEYGSADVAEQFPFLHAYSPLHNLKAGTKYPSTMITTADHDDRVVPAHSFKFAAALQKAHAGDNPVIIRIETRAGHGAGKPTTKIIEETADKWAFLLHELGALDEAPATGEQVSAAPSPGAKTP